MRVLSVASECVPLIKTGGLADVVGALPRALAGQGVDMRVIIPSYPGVEDKMSWVGNQLWYSGDLIGGWASLVEGEVDGTRMLLLRAPHLYDRPGNIYSGLVGDFYDNPERFAALCMVAAAAAEGHLADGWRPDIVHAHDWQGGLAPAYLAYRGTGVRSVLTIHNMAFQGNAPAEKMPWLGLPPEGFNPDGFEYYGGISTLKAGLMTASAITTVSPTYANELMRPEFGLGLQGVMQRRAAVVHGILNGTDTRTWNPGDDPEVAPYWHDNLWNKGVNRQNLLNEFGLGDVPGPLAIVVSRLTWQKGIDLIPQVAADFVAQGGGMVILGSGEPDLEHQMRMLAAAHPGRIATRIGYDEGLSHRMFAGGDAVLVPSRFEPCGLTQMYGLRYGCIPVVAATGGLADTVITASPAALAANAATGLTFHPTDALALAQSLRRLVELHGMPDVWGGLISRAMQADVSWDASSAVYADLYRRLLE